MVIPNRFGRIVGTVREEACDQSELWLHGFVDDLDRLGMILYSTQCRCVPDGPGEISPAVRTWSK